MFNDPAERVIFETGILIQAILEAFEHPNGRIGEFCAIAIKTSPLGQFTLIIIGKRLLFTKGAAILVNLLGEWVTN